MSVWPLVKNAQVALLPTLPGWSAVKVYNGPVVTGEQPLEFATVGFVSADDFGGSFEQDRGLGDVPTETGTVRSEVVCWSGDAAQLPSLEARAFVLLDAWQAAVDADPSLGVPGLSAALSVDVQPEQTTAGAVQRLAVTLAYVKRG